MKTITSQHESRLLLPFLVPLNPLAVADHWTSVQVLPDNFCTIERERYGEGKFVRYQDHQCEHHEYISIEWPDGISPIKGPAKISVEIEFNGRKFTAEIETHHYDNIPVYSDAIGKAIHTTINRHLGNPILPYEADYDKEIDVTVLTL